MNEIDRLFQDYLDVCNQALEENKDNFPYKLICNAAESAFAERAIKLAIYDDRPKECYCLQMKDHKIEASDECDLSHAKDAWRINLSYLQQVVDHPEEYIKHPARLDWDWLRNRIGM